LDSDWSTHPVTGEDYPRLTGWSSVLAEPPASLETTGL
jgi:hypothetical protein